VVDNPQYPAEMVMKNFREAEKLYEKGFDNRYTSTAKDNFKSIEINSTREILLFRTARMKQVNDILSSLHDQYQDSRISVLGQNDINDKLKSNNYVDDVFLYGDGHFNNDLFPQPLLKDLSNRKYSLGVIPYHNISGNGYADVKAIAKRIGIEKMVAVNIEGTVFDLENPGDQGRSHLR
jgi:hypothetical protein